jgi:hypothetical protein
MICTKSLLNSEFFPVSSYFLIYAAFAEVKAVTCLVYVRTQLCAGYGTQLKGEPTIFNYGSQDKSQAQPDGGEGPNDARTE